VPEEPAERGHTFTAFTDRVLRTGGVLAMRARTLKFRINPEGVRVSGASFGEYIVQDLCGNPVSWILLDCNWVQNTPKRRLNLSF
jgi:hypothetical protein